LRIVLILLSAFATAQPFELMLFNGAIEQRLRDETAYAERCARPSCRRATPPALNVRVCRPPRRS